MIAVCSAVESRVDVSVKGLAGFDANLRPAGVLSRPAAGIYHCAGG